MHDIGPSRDDAAGARLPSRSGRWSRPHADVGTDDPRVPPWSDLITYPTAILRVQPPGRRDKIQGADQDSGHERRPPSSPIGSRPNSKPPKPCRRCYRRLRSTLSLRASRNRPIRLPQDDAATVTSPQATMTSPAGSAATCTRTGVPGWRHRHRVAEAASASRPATSPADELDAAAAPSPTSTRRRAARHHEQNLVSARRRETRAAWTCWREPKSTGEWPTSADRDIIARPGGDFCDLANAVRSRSQRLSARALRIARPAVRSANSTNISGCINACGHHHVGHIGIPGVDKHDEVLVDHHWWSAKYCAGRRNSEDRQEIIGLRSPVHEVADVVETSFKPILACANAMTSDFVDVVAAWASNRSRARICRS